MTASTWDDAVNRLRARAYWRWAHAHLPLDDEVIERLRSDTPPEDASGPITERFQLHSLANRDDWLQLHLRYSFRGLGNYAPWNRCLSLLYGHGATTCLVESHYVCLDYKSEVLAFYSQLDGPRPLTTTRLHFFAADLTESSLANLKEHEANYLGYIVCRPGRLPLVGRTIIRPPAYIDECASIEERVNLLGQVLTVEGVPFMQQDSKLAVCSQVAIWAAHYTSFRHGLLQRKLIAEIVAQSGVIEPLKPRISDGLDVSEAAELLRKVGLSTYVYHLGEDLDVPMLVPYIIPQADELVYEIKKRLQSDALEKIRDENQLGEFITDVLSHFYSSSEPDPELLGLTNQLYDAVLTHAFAPYIRSRFPLYMSTRDHALLLCGLGVDTERGGKPLFFVHDDQFGPYLATDSLANGRRDILRYQGYFGDPAPEIFDAENSSGGVKFPDDRTPETIAAGFDLWEGERDSDRAVESIIVPAPRRVTITPADAEADVYSTFGETLALGNWQVRSALMMGIDYKRQRRDIFIRGGDEGGAMLFGNVHLAEWVIVVSDSSEPDGCPWEVVYDASSDARSPTIQMARFGDRVLVEPAGVEPLVEEGTVELSQLPHFVVELKIGKRN